MPEGSQDKVSLVTRLCFCDGIHCDLLRKGPDIQPIIIRSTGYLKVPLVNSTTCRVAVGIQQRHHKWLNSILVTVDVTY
jgi:hypothetical protein